jgi:flagellar hook-length control protein FliK
MIDPMPVPSSPVATAPSASAAKASARPSNFGQTLKAFLDSRDPAADRSAAPASGDARHDPAADGKALPAESDDAASDATPTPWTAALIPVPATPAAIETAPSATIVDGGLAQAMNGSLPPGIAAGPAVGGAPPAIGSSADPRTASLAAALLSEAQPDGGVPPASTQAGAQSALPIDPAIAAALDAALARTSAAPSDAKPSSLASADGAPPLVPPSPDPATSSIIAGAVPQPAGQLFASELATAWRDRAQRSTDPDGSAGVSALGVAAPIHASGHAIVQASGDASQAGLDLTRDTGLQRMIEHIETLRDDMDSRDTRIRLVPDSLGGVDVAVRQVGDRVHVHFTAEQEATRALLSEAQPRLTELAAARGLRIGDTSVSADSGSGNGAAPQPRPALPTTPAPRAAAAADIEIPTDARVA